MAKNHLRIYLNLLVYDLYLHIRIFNALVMRKILNEQLNITKNSPIKVRFFDYEKFTYPWHFHSEYEIMYIDEGFGTCITADNIIDYKDKNLFLFGSSLPHLMRSDDSYNNDTELRVKGVIIQFEKDFMHYSFSNYVQFNTIFNMLKESEQGILFDISNKQEVQKDIELIPTLNGIDQFLQIVKLLDSLTRIKSKKIISSPHFNNTPSFFKDKKIEKVIAYLNLKYTSNITLKDISSYIAMDPAAFCRYFKNSTGKTFKEYILGMRIGYACQLLATERLNISQISAECGFESLSYFNRTFKKYKNMSPSQFINTVRKEKD